MDPLHNIDIPDNVGPLPSFRPDMFDDDSDDNGAVVPMEEVLTHDTVDSSNSRITHHQNEDNNTVPPVNNDDGNEDEMVLGSEIIERFPYDMHFILGVAFFDMNPSNENDLVVDNRQFRGIIKRYFAQLLANDADFVNSLTNAAGQVRYRVVGHVEGVLAMAMATPLERIRGATQLPNRVRIWKKQTPNFLREKTWKTYFYKDVSNGPIKQLKNDLTEPLRSELRRQYPPRAAQRQQAAPAAPQQQVAPVAQRQQAAPAAPQQQAPPAAAAAVPQPSRRRPFPKPAPAVPVVPVRYFPLEAPRPLPPPPPPPPMEYQQPPLLQEQQQLNPIPPQHQQTFTDLHALSSSPPVMRELNVNEDVVVHDMCRQINSPGPYVTSLFTLHNEQEPTSANQYLADRVANAWCDEDTNPIPRFVYRLNASDPGTLAFDYLRQARLIRLQHGDTSHDEEPVRMPRLLPQSAAREFLSVLRSTFPRYCECVIIYTHVGPSDLFADAFLPQGWFQDQHCRATIRGVLLCTPHPEYEGNLGPSFGDHVSQLSVEWKVNYREAGEKYWYDRVPISRLPPLFEDVDEPPGLDRLLEINGRAVALVDPDDAHSSNVANQFARRWEQGVPGRFCFWVDAQSETRLKESYQSIIRGVTFSSANEPFGNPADRSARSLADSLMAFMSRKRELSERADHWTLIFECPTPSTEFHSKFFSPKSNWWNSWGRFIITTSSPTIELEFESNTAPKTIKSLHCRTQLSEEEQLEAAIQASLADFAL